eukprot:14762622-Alexandrium_andersonii.AAC.1
MGGNDVSYTGKWDAASQHLESRPYHGTCCERVLGGSYEEAALSLPGVSPLLPTWRVGPR